MPLFFQVSIVPRFVLLDLPNLVEGWRVCFSDYNREVLEEVTIPNVRFNVEERSWPLADYYSGDWASLSPLLDEVRRGLAWPCPFAMEGASDN